MPDGLSDPATESLDIHNGRSSANVCQVVKAPLDSAVDPVHACRTTIPSSQHNGCSGHFGPELVSVKLLVAPADTRGTLESGCCRTSNPPSRRQRRRYSRNAGTPAAASVLGGLT